LTNAFVCSDSANPDADTSMMSSEDISEHKDDTAVEAVANDYDDADVYIAVESDDDL